MRTVFANIISAAASIGITALAVAASAPAVATNIDTAPSATVQLADLNLKAQAGRETAMRRIEAAATRVCGSDTGVDDAGCRDRVVNGAQQTLAGTTAATPVAAR